MENKIKLLSPEKKKISVGSQDLSGGWLLHARLFYCMNLPMSRTTQNID